jgi:hypothetical protein
MFERMLHPGMGTAVAERTVLRKIQTDSGERFETWGEVADRVAQGNTLLNPADYAGEYNTMRRHIAKATILMSGRHLQHGDADQPNRNQEVFTNCSTAATTFLLFQLLLNGSGVGRAYDDDMIIANWDHAPGLRCVLDNAHPDFDWSAHESVRDAQHKYPRSRDTVWFEVPDTREGWSKAVELWEVMAFEKVHKDRTLVLDFSKVRPKGSPIGGMQSRPASGPVPLMNAFAKAATIKGAGMEPWRQALYVDHYFAECVLVGGARRAARMATKWWGDPSVIDFVKVKRPVEYAGMTMADVLEFREGNPAPPMGFLWSSNNSVTVDAEFWRLVRLDTTDPAYHNPEAKHARDVFEAVCECSYADGTGEPGLINADKLRQNDEGWDGFEDGDWAQSKKFVVNEDTRLYLSRLAKRAMKKPYHMITNPCGEITLTMLGGYCVIADVVPFHADTLDEAEDAFRASTRALVRVNTMDCLYRRETTRTNRIGVGITGVHEFAWKFFQVGFRDMIAPDFDTYHSIVDMMNGDESMVIWDVEPARVRAAAFWMTLSRFSRAVQEEAISYSARLGVTPPHTTTTIKPAGTTSKLFGLTEGWHLPSMAQYLRWVQFRNDDPLVAQYTARGYPVKQLKSYEGTTVVGFPTTLSIAELGMGDALVLAGDASPEEQYQWLMLGEKYWINGTEADGTDCAGNTGNQISYTLKYKPHVTGYEEFREMMLKYQSQVRCCSVMPQSDTSAYEYLPETAVNKAEYEGFVHAIREAADGHTLTEDIDKVHIDCEGGACPVDFNK